MNNLNTFREKLKMSKRSFAASIGVNEGYYNKMEAGTLSISASAIESIKKIYPNVSIDWLLYGTGISGIDYKVTCNSCAEKDTLIAEKDLRLADKDILIHSLQEQITMLKKELARYDPSYAKVI
jgi:transcriptional regulator with XRE-family HTH domain